MSTNTDTSTNKGSMPAASPTMPRQGLTCLGGEPPARQVREDWQALRSLPRGALANLFEILIPCLRAGRLTEEIENRANAFCRLYEVSDAALRASIRVCHLLFTQVARLDLDAATLREDLLALDAGPAEGGAPSQGIEHLLHGFDAAKAALREEIVAATLLDHGDVLTGLDWRVETIAASNRGANLAAPLIVLTLRFRNAGSAGSHTLHLTPQALRDLGTVCDQIGRGIERPSDDETR